MILRHLVFGLFVTLVLCQPVGAQAHEALQFGAPDTGGITDYGTFVMSYDGRLRSARWVAEKLTKQSLVKRTSTAAMISAPTAESLPNFVPSYLTTKALAWIGGILHHLGTMF